MEKMAMHFRTVAVLALVANVFVGLASLRHAPSSSAMGPPVKYIELRDVPVSQNLDLGEICSSTKEEREVFRSIYADLPDVKRINLRAAANVDNLVAKVEAWRGSMSLVRLLCIVLPSDVGTEAAIAAHTTWARKCDHHWILYNTTIESVDPANMLVREINGGFNPQNTYQPFITMLHQLATNATLGAASFDYVAVAPAHTLVVVENVRRMLSEPSTRRLHAAWVPLFLSRRMVAEAPFPSSSLFVVNNAALRVTGVILANFQCSPFHVGPNGDLRVGLCLENFGLALLDTRDAYGEDRIHHWSVAEMMYLGGRPAHLHWFFVYRKAPMPTGLAMVSRHSVAFSEPNLGLWSTYVMRIYDNHF